MKMIVEPSCKNLSYLSYCDGVILPLEGYAVESVCYYTIEEIEAICLEKNCQVFVKVNRNFFPEEMDSLRAVLKRLDSCGVHGVFFYDLAVLQIKREEQLSLSLVWNQTHMVNNYRTCDYYFDKGVSYALLGKEITLEEIIEIIQKSKICCMVEVVSLPSVAYSKRKLVTHYYQDLGESGSHELKVREKITGDFYDVVEDDFGTCFYFNKITNGTTILKDLMDAGCEYIVLREYGIPSFLELVMDTREYLDGGCVSKEYIQKYQKLGDSTNFFFKKTIYKVK